LEHKYNCLLTLKYTNHTKAAAFADDLVILIKAESIREAENIVNVELSEISGWTVNNKIRFNEHIIKSNAYDKKKEERKK